MVDEAGIAFGEGFNCAQAVLSALAPALGLERNLAVRITSGCGGGCGREGELCGALNGAVLAIGMRHGSNEVDPVAKEKTYACVQALFAEFRERNGAVRCRDLLGCDLSTAVGRAEARAKGVVTERCPCFVRDATALAERLLQS